MVRRLGWRLASGAWLALFLVHATNARAHWWAGDGFGARRFCTVLPLLAVGLAVTFDAMNRVLKKHPVLAPSGIVATATLWNVLLAEGHRQAAWAWDVPVSFSQMARVNADLVDRRMGSPFAFPAALWESLRTGRPVADYESAMFRQTFSRFSLRFGDGDVPYLGDGFSVPQGQGDELHRSTRDGRVEFSLHRAEDYLVTLQAAGNEAETLSVEINGRAAFACALVERSAPCQATVGAPFFRSGPNEVRAHVEPVTPATSDARLYSLDLTPTRNVADARPSPTPSPVPPVP